jgi:hypothetical protein
MMAGRESLRAQGLWDELNDHPVARARRTDPDTSHQAAAAVTPGLRELQQRVETFARLAGFDGFTDAEMEDKLDDPGSTLRTRRSELTARNIVLDSGQRRTFGDSTRRRIVWVHRDYHPSPPPICEAPRVLTKEERSRGIGHAAKLDAGARQMRSEGRAGFADQLAEAASYIRGVAA